MRIVICNRCKTQATEGIVCRHCDTAYCYDCLDQNPPDMRLCPECREFLCDECFEGMVRCDRRVYSAYSRRTIRKENQE